MIRAAISKINTPRRPNAPVQPRHLWLRSENETTLFVFIHGVLSSSEPCWTNRNGTYWPELIQSDSTFSRPSMLAVNYHTSINSGGYDTAQCANEVMQALTLPQENNKPGIEYQNILFICHSLGGIVCRRLLEENQMAFSKKNIGLVLIASPSLGSKYASSLQRIAKLYKHKIAEELAENSNALMDLDNRFRRLLMRNTFESLSGAEACEHHGPYRLNYLPIRTPRIVDPESSSRYFGPTRTIPDTDHSSIAKPNNTEHPTHLFLKEYYLQTFKEKIIAPRFALIAASTPRKPNSLFEVYTPTNKEFYITRDIDQLLIKYLKQHSIWLWGPSGVGKTSVAKHLIGECKSEPVEVTLSHLNGENIEDKLTEELVQSFLARGFVASGSGYGAAVEVITACAKNSIIPIFIDEIPLGDSRRGAAIASLIGQLLESTQRGMDDNARFVVCSVNKPPQDGINQKMRSQMQLIQMSEWQEADCTRLFDMIASDLKLTENLLPFKNIVIGESSGSPRFLKTFFRRILTTTSTEKCDPSRALEETKIAMRGQS